MKILEIFHIQMEYIHSLLYSGLNFKTTRNRKDAVKVVIPSIHRQVFGSIRKKTSFHDVHSE